MKKRVVFLIASCFLLLLFGPKELTGQDEWQKISKPAATAVLGLNTIENSTRIFKVDPVSKDIYRYGGLPFQWTKVGGPGKTFVIADQGRLYGLAPDGASVWRYDGYAAKWTRIGGPAGQLYGGPDALYATNPKTKDVYRYHAVANRWDKAGGPGKMFAVGSSGHFYGLAPDGGSVWRYDGYATKWTKIGGPAGEILAGGDKLYATNPNSGDIYQYLGAPGKWRRVGGPGKKFVIDDYGRLFALSPDGTAIMRYDGLGGQWHKIGGPASDIYAGGRTLCAKDATTGELLQYKPGIGLLILAHEDFLKALAPLKKHKEANGIKTHIESWQSFAAKFNGNDLPEQIKKGIASYKETYDVRWVMLVGDSDKFPVRYICRDVPHPKGYQPCDLYYADLFKADGSFENWDGNNNGLYAQLEISAIDNNIDKVDWRPDVALTRVPASTATEVDNYVEKVVHYEAQTFDAPWFKKVLLVTGDWGNADELSDYIANNLLTGFSVIKHYHSTVWPLFPIDNNDIAGSMDKRAQPMTNHINNGVGFINYIGHGSWNDFAGVYDKRHLNGLNNFDKLPVVFTTGCSTGEFAPSPPWQDFYDDQGKFHAKHAPGPDEIVPKPAPIQPGQGASHNCDLEARPEDWLVYRKAGAIAYIGSAGTANPGGFTDKLNRDFYNAFQNGDRTLGDIWMATLTQYIDNYGYFDQNGNTIGKDDWHRNAVWNALVRFHCFGDPSLQVGGIPQLPR